MAKLIASPVEAIVDYLRATNGAAPTVSGEEAFHKAKQALLDTYQPGSREARAIASIGWDEVRRRVESAARDA